MYCLRVVKKRLINLIEQISSYFLCYVIIFSILDEFLFLIFRKIFIMNTIILMPFFIFFFSNTLTSFTSLFSLFVFLFFRKILISFTCFFLKLFLFFFDNIYMNYVFSQNDMNSIKYNNFCS